MTAESEKARFVAMVDALPDPERSIVDGLFWEQVPAREIARRLDWFVSDEPDGKRVQREATKAFDLLAKVAKLLRLSLSNAAEEEQANGWT